MGSWRELVAGSIQTDVARKRADPTVTNFGEIVRAAMKLGIEKKKEARAEATATRGLARQATFQRYPDVAAKEAGVDVPAETTGMPTAPEGTELAQVTYDEAGRATRTFKAPQALDPKTLGTMYNSTVMEIRKHNAMWAGNPEAQIPIPNFDEWMNEQFPNLVDSGGTDTGSDPSVLYGLKPDDIPIEDWDLATMQERIELLEDRGLL